MRALEILRNDNVFDEEYLSRNKIDISGAISELEQVINSKTCEGCKFRNTVKFVQVESETLECCSVCVRNCYDYYEPKDNK